MFFSEDDDYFVDRADRLVSALGGCCHSQCTNFLGVVATL